MTEKVPAKLDNLARDMACFLWECSQLRHALFTPPEFIPLVSERLREYLCKHCADVEMLTAKRNGLKRLDHIPTVEEALAAQQPGLFESYWWVTGWDLNRPTIAKIGVGTQMGIGDFVWIDVGDNCPIGGYKAAAELAGIQFTFIGPIECPEELLK